MTLPPSLPGTTVSMPGGTKPYPCSPARRQRSAGAVHAGSDMLPRPPNCDNAHGYRGDGVRRRGWDHPNERLSEWPISLGKSPS